ncbi:kinesin-like protein KIFC3 isoform X3 [Mugil cephalus]|uniref:kinesin-like protein KIFC3 isoform X2 n=1 Tax=Mugil cephalus TaxID=48193 RepID=UPI001FB573E0|nr:kinesin-like protein KIFC3 isoform X2 [Mugil cephalus]XP_047436948.1 kinesin-like protein KIFC3 isoform X3 [Mugil cephalus]
MYVLCTLAVLTLHSLFKSRHCKEDGPEDGGTSRTRGGLDKAVDRRGEGKSRRGVRRCYSPNRKRVQTSNSLLGLAAMFSTRKTWDLGHAHFLQELWKNDLSLDASSVDFLMSDVEDDASFLSLPTAAFSQRPSLSPEVNETSALSQQLLIQTLQDKVCEFQTRLRSEEVTRLLLLQQLQHSVQERTARGVQVQERTAGGVQASSVRVFPPGERPEEEQLVSRLRSQVEELEEKLLDQSQEVERLRSELGATDLEKQLELLKVENERLKQELKSWRSSELQKLNAAAETCTCSHCPHIQEVESLRREVSHWENQARQRELELEVEKSSRLDEWRRRRPAEAELRLKLGKGATTPPTVQTLDSDKALAEMQKKNEVLQSQLHESQRTCTQLRTQILVYEGEMERAQGQLEAEMQNLEEEKNRVIEEAFVRAESEMKAVHENLAGVRINLLTLQPALRTLTCDYNCLKRQVQDFPFMLDKAIAEAKHEICQVISEVSSTNQELLRKYKREMNLRKKCHNELVRLKGNIRVFCRVRPVSQEEQDSADAKTMLSFDSDDDAILYLSNKGKMMTFDLDKVFPPQATQEEVFQEVQALVTSCIDGFNVCIFAYGQTGSGKTYTMEGVANDPGINQRALRLLFSEVTEKSPDWDYKITVNMVEIYNETLRDLLRDNPTDKLDIKMNPDGSGQLYVPGLTEFTVQSPEDVNRVFDLGYVNRATACTNLNEHSSRSHALLIITVSGFNTATGNTTQGKLNLVDLAGSERIGKSGAEGSRLREAQCINKSLSALGDVINALRNKHAHVPFRNSRLTYLLQDALSGDSKTLMMVQVSPLPANMSESVCSLKFAQRVRSIELSSSSSRRHENSSTSSSPTHDSVELDSPPVTPVPLPISRASSAGSTLSSASRTPGGSRRRSQSQLTTDRQVDRGSPLVGDGGQDD